MEDGDGDGDGGGGRFSLLQGCVLGLVGLDGDGDGVGV